MALLPPGGITGAVTPPVLQVFLPNSSASAVVRSPRPPPVKSHSIATIGRKGHASFDVGMVHWECQDGQGKKHEYLGGVGVNYILSIFC